MHVPLCDNKGILEDTRLKEIINELSLNTNYNYTYDEQITITHKERNEVGDYHRT